MTFKGYKMRPEMVNTFRGYKIKLDIGYGHALYVKSFYRGKYTFCTDYTYARCFSACKANEHINRINMEE